MAFTKITEADLQNKGVIGLPDTPGLSTTEMQEKFDEIALDVLAPKHNGLIDEMEASTAAANIGAVDVNNEASTVQAELNKIKQGGYTKAETDALLANKVDTISGKGLSTNDFTDAYKDKLNGIEDNANNYVLPKGTQSTLGGVMGDGTTFTIDSNGVGHAVGGGGGGTSDYNALINKPKINNVEVIGDKSGSDFGFLSPVITITSDAGSTVKIKKGTTEIDAVPVTTTTWKAVPSDYGTWTVSSTMPGADEATGTVTVDAVKQYSVTVEHITATITATYPNDATYCTCSKGSTTYTATSNPQTFTVRSTGTWTVETSLNGIVKSATTTISADGDSQSVTIEYADIEVTYDNNFKGKTITCTNGTLTYTKTAPTTGNTVTFTIPSTGTWTVRSEVSGTTYSQNVVVSSYTSYSASLAVFNATITITFPYSNGATCTCNSETATSSPYTFNIGATGTYTATCTLDGVSKTQSFTITTDGQTESYTFTYGTINLTYDNEFRGLTLTCTDSSYTITKTAPSTGNTMVFYPNETNTWTISGTYSGVTYTTTATVSSLSTPVSAILQTIPNGSTATPTDVVQTWLKCATINDKSYTTLNEVLADTDTFTALLQDSNACDYMARSTTWAIAEGKIPTMTSNTTPSGVASASAFFSTGYEAYRAFDKNSGTEWNSNGNESSSYLEYEFPSAQSIKRVSVVNFADGYSHNTSTTAKIQAYDGASWINISDAFGSSGYFSGIIYLNDTNSYTKFRMQQVSGSKGMSVKELQFYADDDITSDADAMARIGKYDYCSNALQNNSTWLTAITGSMYFESILNVKVPKMTSNTAPSGEAFTDYAGNVGAYYVFDGDNTSAFFGSSSTATQRYCYDFGKAVRIAKATHLSQSSYGGTTKTIRIQYSDDKTTWTDASSPVNFGTAADVTTTIVGNTNVSAHRYWCVYLVTDDASSWNTYTVQFYGRNEAQTNIIHSAASDTLYYIDGSNQTIGTTDTSGVGTVDWSNVPVGNLTIYSSVANDPDDLTSAYSKTVRITPNTVEVWAIPDDVIMLYWFGYIDNKCESVTTSNGWGFGGGSWQSINPTYNINSVSLTSASTKFTGIGTKTAMSVSKLKAIVSGNTMAGDEYGELFEEASKSMAGTTYTSITNSAMTLYEHTPSGTKYLGVHALNGRACTVSAMWLE